jgi:addiction module HigA family antidote
MTTLPKKRPPTHPGEMLREEFLIALDMTQTELAHRIGVSYPRVNEIINGKRGVTPDTALRLARLFRTSPEFWLNGQRNWDLWQALHSPKAAEIHRIKPVAA